MKSASAIRTATLLTVFFGTLSLGCKQRQDSATVKDATSNTPDSLDAVILKTQSDLDALGATTEAGSSSPNSSGGAALGFTDSYVTEMTNLAAQLKAQLDSGTAAKADLVKQLFNDLQVLNQLVGSDLSPTQQLQIGDILTRATNLLHNPKGIVCATFDKSDSRAGKFFLRLGKDGFFGGSWLSIL